jgi:peptidoglycan/LPS O-acetylase OafA/YrhL
VTDSRAREPSPGGAAGFPSSGVHPVKSEPPKSARPPAVPRAELAHIAPLDGLRGLAVLLVLVFHLSWTFPETTPVLHAVHAAQGIGWVGVDLFFVLSGYLITRGLVAESTRPLGERLRLFWTRRFLRIFPLYYAFLGVGTAIALACGAWVPGAAYWLYVQNYALAFDPVRLHWTSHLWSLAIEEQFYFAWPLFALLVPPKKALPATLALFATGAVVRVLLVKGVHLWDIETTAKLAYRAMPTHMDGLLLGAAVAMMARSPESPIARAWARGRAAITAVSGVLLAALIVKMHGFDDENRVVIAAGYPLLALFFTGSVSLAVERKLPAALDRALSRGVLPACGKVSYGMYILHWPLVTLLATSLAAAQETVSPGIAALMTLGFMVLGTLVTYGAAWVSFRYFEAPFLRLKERFHG